MKRLSPLMQYQHDLQASNFFSDPSQAKAIYLLQDLFTTIEQQKGLLYYIRKLFRQTHAIRGIYLWGNVGSGKTYLMDTFYHCLADRLKKRWHFHTFIRDVHLQLKQSQGERDPLKKVAKHMLGSARVVCFDEFFVDDIADAMLLGRLFSVMFSLGIILVTTSNLPIKKLYQHGLQRQRFLPTIALLESYTHELKVDNQRDYRLSKFTQGNVFFSPLNKNSQTSLQQAFSFYSEKNHSHGSQLLINQREIQIIAHADGVVYIDFQQLCVMPMMASDYLFIAQQFHTLLLSGVPILSDQQDDAAARRFITLIDILYEQQVHLFLSMQATIDKLYQGEKLTFEFKRTVSRLQEMQSKSYIERAISRRYTELGI